MGKLQKCSTKGEGQLLVHLAELTCPSKRSKGRVVLLLPYIPPLMLSFLSNKNGLLFLLCILDLTYVHYQALHIILFCSFSLTRDTFLSKQSHDAVCGWEDLPQHTPRSHLLFSVEILLRKPKCLNKSWQRVG